MRRDYPEPLIALLMLVLGIWLWDHYFGKTQGYAPGTEQIALVKIDRDLRLADAMAGDAPWLRFFAGASETNQVRSEALEVLEKLAADNSITPLGLRAYAVIHSIKKGLPIQESVSNLLEGQTIPDSVGTSNSLANHRGSWWDAKMLESSEPLTGSAMSWRPAYDSDASQLRTRALFARSAVWIVGLIGLAFLPPAVRSLKNGISARPNYGDAWTIPLGMVVFLVATLAWIGFTLALEVGIGTLPNLHPAMALFLDSSARLLPSLIAIGLLFRRPMHAVRVMGISRFPAIGPILGVFSLLLIFEQLIRLVAGSGGGGDPGGGLSAVEAGGWGLVFALVSACFLAPVAEEILYRGVLFRSFKNRIGVVPGALVSSAIFALLHFYDGWGLLSVGVFGFSCALLYSSTRSLSSVIMLHMLYNASIKVPEWIVYHCRLG